MVTTLRSPFLVEEHTKSRVVVYFYSGQWIPIMIYTLGEAIALHHRALQQGKELFIFPLDCNPNSEPANNIASYPNLKRNSSPRAEKMLNYVESM